MEWIQVVIILFVLFAYSRAILRFKDKAIDVKEFVFWSVLWISAIVAVIYPASISYISTVFGVGRAVDFAVYISIILLFYLMFRLYVKLDQLRQDNTQLVREIAIKRAKKK